MYLRGQWVQQCWSSSVKVSSYPEAMVLFSYFKCLEHFSPLLPWWRRCDYMYVECEPWVSPQCSGNVEVKVIVTIKKLSQTGLTSVWWQYWDTRHPNILFSPFCFPETLSDPSPLTGRGSRAQGGHICQQPYRTKEPHLHNGFKTSPSSS